MLDDKPVIRKQKSKPADKPKRVSVEEPIAKKSAGFITKKYRVNNKVIF